MKKTGNPKKLLRLNTIIIALAVLAGVIPILVAGILFSQIAEKQIQDEIKTISQEFVEQEYIRLIQLQKQINGLFVSIESNNQVIDYFSSSKVDYIASENISSIDLYQLLTRNKNNDWIESIDLVRMDGQILTSRITGSGSQLKHETIAEYIIQTRKNPAGIYYEGIKQSGSPVLPDKTRISVIKQVQPKGSSDPLEEPIGFIIVNLSTARIYESLDPYRFAEGSQLYISDGEHRILFAYDYGRVGMYLPDDLSGSLGESRKSSVNNIKGIETFLVYHTLKPSNWTILLTIPVSSISGRSTDIQKSVGFIILVTLVTAIILAFLIIPHLVKPIIQMASYLREMREGTFDWKKRVTGSQIAELDELNHWFNAYIEDEENNKSIQLALNDSEMRYRSLFENSPVALWEEDFSEVITGLEAIGVRGETLRKYLENHPDEVIQLLGKIIITDINKATLNLYGYVDKESLLNNSNNLFHRVSHNALVDELMEIQKRNPVYEVVVDNSCSDGRVIQVKLRWSVFPGHEENMDKVIVITEDVTQQIQVNKMQSAIYRISEAATSTENLQELYRSIHKILGELMPANNFYIALYDGIDGMISFPYHVDENDPHPMPKKFGNGWTEYVIRTGQSVLLSPDNILLLEELEGVKTNGTDSIDWLGVPLKIGDKIIGMLAVQTYSEGVRYSEREKDILVFVSNQIAMAIDRKRSEERLLYSSTHDTLTGLYNRGYYEEEIHRLSSGRQNPVGVIIMDIDGLKITNDKFGHAAGDELLRSFAKVLQKEFRTSDVVARLGGDEFGILLPLSSINIVKKAVGRIQNSVKSFNETNPKYQLSFSVGYYTNEESGSVSDAILMADSLMYQDKAHKRENEK